MTHLIEKCGCGAVLDITSTIWGEVPYAHKRFIEAHKVCRQNPDQAEQSICPYRDNTWIYPVCRKNYCGVEKEEK